MQPSGHVIDSQSPASHSTSHAQASLHVTAPHDAGESHETSQIPFPHLTDPQDPSVMHVTEHAVSSSQRMSPQAPGPSQTKSHSYPAGHSRSPQPVTALQTARHSR